MRVKRKPLAKIALDRRLVRELQLARRRSRVPWMFLVYHRRVRVGGTRSGLVWGPASAGPLGV
jgi:hypothetical protein